MATPNSENSLPTESKRSHYNYLYYSRLCIVELEPKPSKENLEELHDDLSEDEMGMERNRLLKDSDYTAFPDYPSSNKQIMSEYRRQQLRDFPTVWNAGVPFLL